jgi:hypothetical protein
VVQAHDLRPRRLTGYAAQFLPAIADAIREGDAATANRYRDLALDSLERATELASRPGADPGRSPLRGGAADI